MTRVAVVTGGGSKRGIGVQTGRVLIEQGFDVALLDRDVENVHARASEIGALAVGADITVRDQVARALDEVERQFGRIDAVVNNAGYSAPTRIMDVTDEEWEAMFRVHALGTFHVTQLALARMIPQKYGRIVNVSSVAAKRGGGVFGGSHYAAAKGAVLGFTRAVAREVAPHGITCNAVAPSMIDTDIFGDQMSNEQRAGVLATIPLGRVGVPADVAYAIAFLCSEHAAYITGEIMDVNGGSHID